MNSRIKIYKDPAIIKEHTTAVERFVSYVQLETTSDPKSSVSPSTPGQRVFADKLVNELKKLDLHDANVDSNGYVTATLKGVKPLTVGLIAHMDTSNAFNAKSLIPVIHKNYDGSDIVLKNGVTISPDNDEHLKKCIKHTIITADGTTLLGADDKAGIAIIMGLLEYIKKFNLDSLPTIKIGFTPDEEIGRGALKFPYDDFNADVAFTLDGTVAGELNFETFEAYSICVDITGVSIHPGQAKGKLVNALRYGAELINRLPMHERPENTEKREGFLHPVAINGDSTKCTVELIARDFDAQKVKDLCQIVENTALDLKKEEPRLTIDTKVEFSYPNMYKYIQKRSGLVEILKKSVEQAGIKPVVLPVRGGTDGSGLSMNGLVTPNIFTGAINIHGPKEWISVENMGYSLCTVLNLITQIEK